MADSLRLRRGTTAQTNSFTGAVAEVTVDTDKKTVVVHDGTTPGGFPLMRADAAVSGGAVSNVAGTMMVLVSEQVLSAASSSITFTGLDGDTDVEYEVHGHIVSGAGATYTIRFNGDATIANYKNEFVYGQGTTAYAGTDSTLGGIRVTSSASAGQTATFEATVAAKTGSARNVLALMAAGVSTASIYNTLFNAGTWTNTSANITSITLTAELGNGSTAASGFGSGTRVALYARKKIGGSASNVSASFRGALLKRSSAQTIPNTTWVAVSWDSAQYDTDGFWSSATPTRLTIPAGVNKVRITSAVGVAAGAINTRISKNGAQIYPVPYAYNSNPSPVDLSSPVIPVQAGDYFTVELYQNSGSTQALNNQDYSYFSLEVVDPVPVAVSGFGSNTTSDYAFVTNSSQATPVNLPAVNGNIPFDLSTGTLSLSSNGIRLKAGKTYELEATLYVTFSAAAGWLDYQFHDGTNWLGIAGEALPVTYTANYAPSAGARAVVTPMVDTTVYLRVKTIQNATTFSPGASYVVVKQIGGPSNGLNYGPAGYASLSFTGDPVTLTTTTDAIIPFPNLTGNLTAANGGVTLKAGRTYLLQASIHMSNSATGGYLSYRFHDGTAYIGNQAQSLALNYVGSVGSNTVATAVYRPSVDTTVTLRVANANGTVSAYGSNSFFNVMELASTEDTYSTAETLTDKVWHDGKPVWRKVIDFGAMPNATTKQVPHGVTGITNIVSVTGIATGVSGDCYPLPRAHQTAQYIVDLFADKTTYVSMGTGYNYSTGYTAKVILEYTK